MLVAIEWNAVLSMGCTPVYGEVGELLSEVVDGDTVVAVGLLLDGIDPHVDDGERLPTARAAHDIVSDEGSEG